MMNDRTKRFLSVLTVWVQGIFERLLSPPPPSLPLCDSPRLFSRVQVQDPLGGAQMLAQTANSP